MPRREPIYGNAARTIEELIGLKPYSLTSVERRANGCVALTFRQQVIDRRSCRVLRIPFKRLIGYEPRSSTSRPSDQRHRRRLGQKRFSWWLADEIGITAPVVARALFDRDLSGIEELRGAVLSLLPPDVVILGWRRAA